MSYCVQCGKMVPDGATLCQDCQAKNMPVQPVQPVAAVAVKQKPKIKKLWIILGAVAVLVVAVVLVLVALFRPRDLRMEDFQRVNGFTAYFHYGVPDRSYGTQLNYHDNDDLTFYGITPLLFTVHPEGDRVTFLFDEGDAGDVVDVIIDNCDYEYNTFEEFYYFSHNNLEIVVSSDGTYMSIDILE